jgi:hypothetical protein
MARVLNVSIPAKPERQLCCWPNCHVYLEDLELPLCDKHAVKVYQYMRRGMYEDLEHDLATTVAKTRQNRDAIGNVYFIRFGNRVKIGFSTQPNVRLGNIPHDEVLAVIPGTLADERALHRRFAHLREVLPSASAGGGPREWFRIAPDLVQYIAEAKKNAA